MNTVSEGPPPPPLAGQPPYPLLDETTYAPGYGALREGGSTFEVQRIPGITWPNGAEGPQIGPGVVDSAADGAGNVYLTRAESMEGEVRIRRRRQDMAGAHPGRFGRGDRHLPHDRRDLGGPRRGRLLRDARRGPSRVGPCGRALDRDPRLDARCPGGRAQLPPWHLVAATAACSPICTGGIISCDIEGAGRTLLEYFDIQPMPDGRIAGVWASDLEMDDRTVNVFGVTRDPLLDPETGG